MCTAFKFETGAGVVLDQLRRRVDKRDKSSYLLIE
jgi:hypothetical protein